MNKILIHKNKQGRDLPKYSAIILPSYLNIPKYTKFKNFLENNVDKEILWPACDNQDIGALEVDQKNVLINLQKCIGCLMCLSTDKELKELELNPNDIIKSMYPENIAKKIKDKDIFDGSIFHFPYFKDRKTNSFNQFTSHKETTHISLWSTTILNFLSSDKNSRMGKEIEIMKMDNPRDGRLDVCIDSNETVFVGEAKVDLNSAITENRYRVQVPSYEKECQRFIDEFNNKYKKNKELFISLIIGGEETDILPESHPECSSISGGKSKRFYQDLLKHEIKFISANTLLLMSLSSMYHKKKICWDLLFPKIFRKGVIGLLTAGIVVEESGKVVIKPLSKEVIEASEINVL